MSSNSLASTLASITPGPEQTFANLTMVTLQRAPGSAVPPAATKPRRNSVGNPARDGGHTLDYLTLDEAISQGWVEITEVSEHGSVPELRVVNRGSQSVLIVDGEELLGAKQNRVVNLTILVPAQAALTIPVSCVEAGRWRSRSRTFASAPRAQYATGRAKRMAQVSACMRDMGAHFSDQAEVWSDIAEKSARMGASSPTSAMEALFVDYGSRIDEFVQAMTPVEGQVGALFVVSGTIVGLDLFDRPSTLRKMLPKLVRSVAIDAIDSGGAASEENPSGSASKWNPHGSAARVNPHGSAARVNPSGSASNENPSGSASEGNPRGSAARVNPSGSASNVNPSGSASEENPCGSALYGLTGSAAFHFLAALASAHAHVAPALGLGDDVRLSAPGLTGAALVVDGQVVHASGFAV